MFVPGLGPLYPADWISAMKAGPKTPSENLNLHTKRV